MFQPIPMDEFLHRTDAKIPEFPNKFQFVVSLRDIVEISAVQVMPLEYMKKIIRNVTLEGDSSYKPYKDAEISLARMDPHELNVGQTFIERKKYQSILENFGNALMQHYCVPRGIAKAMPVIVFGKTAAINRAVALYLPPIIESNSRQFLIDGIHRNFVVMRTGTTIESIIIKNVDVPLPCDIGRWDMVEIMDEKPPREMRFHNLNVHFFRNLKFAGVDG